MAAHPPDQAFEPTERLFLRLHPTQYLQGSQSGEPHRVLVNAVRFPDFSVNRERYSAPLDVLKPDWEDFGVAAFAVQDVPGSLEWRQGADVRLYEFRVEHAPEPDNYAHSEVRTYHNGERGHKPTKEVRLQFRMTLAERMEVVRDPQSAA